MLVFVCARLVPIYFRNVKLQQYLEEVVAQDAGRRQTDDMLRIAIVNRAARLELPVKTSQIRLNRDGGSLRIEILYVVPVEFLLYTVDLHFRPAAGQ